MSKFSIIPAAGSDPAADSDPSAVVLDPVAGSDPSAAGFDLSAADFDPSAAGPDSAADSDLSAAVLLMRKVQLLPLSMYHNSIPELYLYQKERYTYFLHSR